MIRKMIGLRVSGGVARPCPTARHRPRPPNIAFSRCRRSPVEKIELREIDARDLRHLEQVDRDHLAPAVGRADALGRDLAPAARRRAEIDHPRCPA